MLRVSKLLVSKNIPVDPHLAETAYQTILHQLKSIPDWRKLSQDTWAWDLGPLAEKASPGILEQLPRRNPLPLREGLGELGRNEKLLAFSRR